eukprot:gene19201-biopygen10012
MSYRRSRHIEIGPRAVSVAHTDGGIPQSFFPGKNTEARLERQTGAGFGREAATT